jgi:hypothetical protein
MNGLATIRKEANFGKAMRSVGEAVVPIVGAAVALKGINSFINSVGDRMERRKFNGVIDYAKKKHPELRRVPHEDMKNWMAAFHTLSPKIAVNKELGASMLSTVHSYGGNIDLATAKLIAETGEKSRKQSSGDSQEILSYIGTGNTLASKGLSGARNSSTQG